MSLSPSFDFVTNFPSPRKADFESGTVAVPVNTGYPSKDEKASDRNFDDPERLRDTTQESLFEIDEGR
jgi:hypothetical protein